MCRLTTAPLLTNFGSWRWQTVKETEGIKRSEGKHTDGLLNSLTDHKLSAKIERFTIVVCKNFTPFQSSLAVSTFCSRILPLLHEVSIPMVKIRWSLARVLSGWGGSTLISREADGLESETDRKGKQGQLFPANRGLSTGWKTSVSREGQLVKYGNFQSN